MDAPLVSIITPTYNRADLLPETVESVLRQDYPRVEYIVLDDGSEDATCEAMAPYLGRLQYLYHDNMGETSTVNKGFGLARGEIVCVINSDDPFFRDDAISIAVSCLQDNPDALMAYPDWVLIDKTGKVISYRELPDYSIENMISGRNVAIGPGMFIRKSTIDKIGLRDPDVKYAGDLDYTFRMASVGKIVRIPAFLATHRTHTHSLSSCAKGRRMSDEVLGLLCTKYIDGEEVPACIKARKSKILAEWYFMSIYYLGCKFPTLSVTRLVQAFKSCPATTVSMIAALIMHMALLPAYKIRALMRKMRGFQA